MKSNNIKHLSPFIKGSGFLLSLLLFIFLLTFFISRFSHFIFLVYILIILILSIIFLFLAGIIFYKSKTILLSRFFRGFKKFGKVITTIVNSILLTILYFVGIGITSIIGKYIFKKDFLEFNTKKDSYFIKNEESNKTIDEHRRLF